MKNQYHADGTVTFWSVYHQKWCRSAKIPARELAAMSEKERNKVQKHVGMK